MNHETASIVKKVIQQRQTFKVLADPQNPINYSEDSLRQNDQLVSDAVASAGWAPFHYDRGIDSTPEPWRVHFVGAKSCRKLSLELSDWFSDLKPNNKLQPMLAACGCLVLVNWLPQFRGESPTVDRSERVAPEKQTQIDDEHLAATSAFVQNLLLVLTAEGLGTYWSSGGQLGRVETFSKLGIDPTEKLLAAVFVEYPDATGNVTDRIEGKHRKSRTPASHWFRNVTY